MSRFPTGRLFATFVLAVLLEPVGHMAAYTLRYGPAQAWMIQSQGSHLYFAGVFTLSSVSLTVAAALALVAVVSIRLILGHRPLSGSGLRQTFVILALTQCGLFMTKETLEALAVQAIPDPISIGVLAVSVQLPLAALAAFVISWIRGYLELVPEAFQALLAIRLAAPVSSPVLRANAHPVRRFGRRDQRWYRRRGPPTLFLI